MTFFSLAAPIARRVFRYLPLCSTVESAIKTIDTSIGAMKFLIGECCATTFVHTFARHLQQTGMIGNIFKDSHRRLLASFVKFLLSLETYGWFCCSRLLSSVNCVCVCIVVPGMRINGWFSNKMNGSMHGTGCDVGSLFPFDSYLV
jgi:hypothetical protein